MVGMPPENEKLREHLKGLEQFATTYAGAALTSGEPQRLIRSLAKIQRIADEEFHAAQEAANQFFGKPVDCEVGCDHCCHQPVVGTRLELLGLVMWIRENFDPTGLDALKARLKDYVALRTDDPAASELGACPLLSGGQCLAYAMRPLACRAHHSYRVASCERLRYDPSWVSEHQDMDVLTNEIQASIRQGLKAADPKVAVYFLAETLDGLLEQSQDGA